MDEKSIVRPLTHNTTEAYQSFLAKERYFSPEKRKKLASTFDFSAKSERKAITGIICRLIAVVLILKLNCRRKLLNRIFYGNVYVWKFAFFR